MSNDRLDFFQQVEISASSPYRGLTGSVLSVREEGGVIQGYGVFLHGESRVIYFDKDEVTPTRVRFSRDEQ